MAMCALVLLAKNVHCRGLRSCRCTSGVLMALACADETWQLCVLSVLWSLVAPLFPPKQTAADLNEFRDFWQEHGCALTETEGHAGFVLARRIRKARAAGLLVRTTWPS